MKIYDTEDIKACSYKEFVKYDLKANTQIVAKEYYSEKYLKKKWMEVFDENNKLIEERINKKTIFQTYINKEKNNERLKKSLLKAFKKAGFEVTNEYWYD